MFQAGMLRACPSPASRLRGAAALEAVATKAAANLLRRHAARVSELERMPTRSRSPAACAGSFGQLLGCPRARPGWLGRRLEGRSFRGASLTRGGKGIHPGAMPHGFGRHPKPGQPSDGWLHSLASLLAVVARGGKARASRHQQCARRLRHVWSWASGCWIPCLQPLRSGLREGQASGKPLRGRRRHCCCLWLLGRVKSWPLPIRRRLARSPDRVMMGFRRPNGPEAGPCSSRPSIRSPM